MTRVYKHYQRRIAFLSLLIIFAWAGLGYQLFNIQILNGKEYYQQSHKQGQIKEQLSAIRGNVYDVNGEPFTRNTIHYTIAADPSNINDVQKISHELSAITGKPSKYYSKKMDSNYNFVYLERNLKKKYAQTIIDKDIEGLIIQRHARRSYPQDYIGGQIIGFTDVDDQGIAGIEHIYDKYLSGQDGWVVKQRSGIGEVNLKNNYPKQDPIDGYDIHLTINIKYQSVLHEELARQLNRTNAENATGIIVNPQTGAILAIASVPDFNPNNPGKYPIENQKLRAITDQFEPGSTYKIVAATAAIENRAVDIADKFNCENGEFKYNNITITDHKPYDILTFGEIIEHSSNIGIIKVASRVGPKSIYRYSQEYGFGSITNIGLSAETNGTLRKLDDWSKISLAEVAMGHEVGISAIQLAMAYSTIANDGILLKPYIVSDIRDNKGKTVLSEKPTAVRRVSSKNVMDTLTDLLVKAVEKGTGTKAYIPGWQVAGKTGTAQKNINGRYSNSKFTSSFVGFFPANNPQLLCVIILDEPKLGYHWGAVGAAPVFKNIMERIINFDDTIKPPKNGFIDLDNSKPILVEKQIKPTKKDIQSEPILLSSTSVIKNGSNKPSSQGTINNESEVVVPNVKGMSLKKAIRILNRTGLQSKFAGSGRVIWQSPNPGTVSQAGTVCSIGLE